MNRKKKSPKLCMTQRSTYTHNSILPLEILNLQSYLPLHPTLMSEYIYSTNPNKTHISMYNSLLCSTSIRISFIQSISHPISTQQQIYMYVDGYTCDEIYQQKKTPSYHTHPINTSDPKHVKASNILQSNSHRKSFTSLILLMLRVSKCRISVTSIFICCTA